MFPLIKTKARVAALPWRAVRRRAALICAPHAAGALCCPEAPATHARLARCAVLSRRPHAQVTDAAELHSPDEAPAKVLAALKKVMGTLNAMSAQSPFMMADLKVALEALDAVARKHFAGVEAVPIKALRTHFTKKECIWSLEKHLVDDGEAKLDAGWMLYRAFANDAARDSWMHRVPEISSERRKHVDLPACHAYAASTHKLLEEILSGKHERHVSVKEAADCCVIA